MSNRDVTLGQYVPGRSPVHRTDPRIKLVLAVVFSATLFVVNGWTGYGALAGYVIACTALARLPWGLVVRSLRPILLLVVLTIVFHGVQTPGAPLAVWGPVEITGEGLTAAVRLAVRLVLLAAGVSLVTLTTSPVAMTDGLERLLSPGRRLGLPAAEIAFMVSLALRFIPTLAEEFDRIVKAQKARGADWESGGVFRRARALVPVLVPLFVRAFRRADGLALALESRCWRGAEGRTQWRSGRVGARDWLVLVGSLVLFGVVGWRCR
ncbi:MAG: hypothetical protein BAA04_06610 [Firmicutes bacterium ZCTH02-B6]|nr:MAG: hypothetical protein BAA04_06610 [Firmicutes bacterium ZCTH02-B6]